MGKLGNIAIILGLGIVGGVLFMFATGRWKFPSAEQIKEEIKKTPLGPLVAPAEYRWQAPFWYEEAGAPPETPLGYMLGPLLEPRKYRQVGLFQYQLIEQNGRVNNGQITEPVPAPVPAPIWGIIPPVPAPAPVTYAMPKITPEKVAELKYEYRMTEMERKVRGML